MWLMLQQSEPDDYVIATGNTLEFLDVAFGYVNLNWQDYIEFDERYLRPSEVELLMEIPQSHGRSWAGHHRLRLSNWLP